MTVLEGRRVPQRRWPTQSRFDRVHFSKLAHHRFLSEIAEETKNVPLWRKQHGRCLYHVEQKKPAAKSRNQKQNRRATRLKPRPRINPWAPTSCHPVGLPNRKGPIVRHLENFSITELRELRQNSIRRRTNAGGFA